VEHTLGVKMNVITGNASNAGTHELILFSVNREECKELTDSLGKDEYAIKTVVNAETGTQQVILASKGNFARLCAVDRLIKEYLTDDGFILPANVEVRGTCSEDDVILTLTQMQGLRDPFPREGFQDLRVVEDGCLITAQGHAFIDFAEAVCRRLGLDPDREPAMFGRIRCDA
jgi:hypothetical protein